VAFKEKYIILIFEERERERELERDMHVKTK